MLSKYISVHIGYLRHLPHAPTPDTAPLRQHLAARWRHRRLPMWTTKTGLCHDEWVDEEMQQQQARASPHATDSCLYHLGGDRMAAGPRIGASRRLTGRHQLRGVMWVACRITPTPHPREVLTVPYISVGARRAGA